MTPTVKFAKEVDLAAYVFRSLWLNLERQVKARAGDLDNAFPKPWPELCDASGSWN